MQRVLVIDRNQQPLMPCFPARARELLRSGKAAVFRRYPYTIILKERASGDVQPIAFKVDPGSRVTGIALVADFQHGKRVIWAGELIHRGRVIKTALATRRVLRSNRRNRKTRYRQARFDNRRRREGWLSPSLMSRVYNLITWGSRLRRFTAITTINMELVRFDTQALQNPEICGVEYQQGELMGYEVREYLLEKWGRKCVYCGTKDKPLEVEHIIPKSRGGSNRVSNLTLACNGCNQRKGSQTADEFGYPNIQQAAKAPLKDAAAVNATRWALFGALKSTGLPVEVGTGGRTKYNRTKQGYPKTHWLDAACVSESGEHVYVALHHIPLIIKATGRGSRQMCRVDKYGFPRTSAKANKRVHGFQTGELVRAVITTGSKTGAYIGRVAVRSSGSFNITTDQETMQSISYKHCVSLHKSDGYNYMKGKGALLLHA